jgi:fission process protein 1
VYKCKKLDYHDTHGHPVTVPQIIVERGTFQLLASLALPYVMVHSAVHVGHHITHKIGRFQKYGPSILGLSMVPLLPAVVDQPVEHALEYFFETYGPWATEERRKHHH